MADPSTSVPTQQAPALGAGLNGAWRRSLLDRGDGTVDTDSDVLWLQAGSAFVDLRLPTSMPPPRAVRCLREADRDLLMALARADGFAGELTGQGDRFCWQHEVDLHPADAGEGPDAGLLSWSGSTLVETGIHAVYTEHWHREAGAPDPVASLLLRQPETGATAVLVRCGARVGWARARAVSVPAGPDGLVAAIEAAADLRAAQDLLDTEICFADVTRGGPVIRRSSLPFRQGNVLEVVGRGGRVLVSDVLPDGTAVRREWSIVAARGSVSAMLTDLSLGEVLR
jgi:hypothetical protein